MTHRRTLLDAESSTTCAASSRVTPRPRGAIDVNIRDGPANDFSNRCMAWYQHRQVKRFRDTSHDTDCNQPMATSTNGVIKHRSREAVAAAELRRTSACEVTPNNGSVRYLKCFKLKSCRAAPTAIAQPRSVYFTAVSLTRLGITRAYHCLTGVDV